MYCLKEHRRQGIAGKLLLLIVNEARDFGCEMVQVTTSPQAVTFYEDCGLKRNENFLFLRV
jgi:GNAT superfamily N-acetyltransferase